MKKSIKVSLGGMAFNVEEDAYAVLEEYIESLKNHLGDTPEAAEVVVDIEERASELFAEQLGGRQTITIDMVNDVIKTLGRPEQIANEDDAEQTSSFESDSERSTTRRRIYRDSENAIIAGVASGLGQYFGIEPLVFRILFAVLLFANGLGAIIYAVMWIAVPRAETTRQRMEMKGEDINFSNLEKNLQEEINKVKQNMEKRNLSGFFERVFSAFGKIFIAIGKVLGAIVKVMAVVFAVAFISIGLILLLLTTISLFFGGVIVSIIPSYSGITISELIGTTFDIGSTLWVTIPVYFVIAIPLIAIVFVGLRMIFRFKMRDSVAFVTGATAWILAVTILAFVLFFQARSFSIRETVKDVLVLKMPNDTINTLRFTADIDQLEQFENGQRMLFLDEYIVDYSLGEQTIMGKPKIFIGKSTSDSYEIVLEKKSRGATKQLARRSADGISLPYKFYDNNLQVNPYFILKRDDKWRAQDIEVTLKVPEGKRVYIHNTLEPYLSSDQDYCLCWPDEMVNRVWLMKGERLVEVK
ncbi:MAG TPA: PspC domain-containing protein [Tenuifilaceae bacterium]|nr:PspC domain-containing protein [Tenuifilaceae bacterium]